MALTSVADDAMDSQEDQLSGYVSVRNASIMMVTAVVCVN